ncbi:MAG: hypothetical protein HN509_06710 [Halobacteriovoraceae bacterium]|jgi:hypothetical protein|nr:hypothetical protein [Halobacteriovoraceae bacterium]MBT5094816.1 hypothetical protein [Halobacteriovoraceae bacterium]
MAKINHPVKLSECQINGVNDFVNWFFEYLIFFRWIYFKNRPRGNFLLIRAFLAVGFLALIYYYVFSSFHLVLQGIDIEPLVAFIILTTVGYWNMSSIFHQKSAHCANLYRDFLREMGKGNKKAGELVKVLLASNLLTVDLWAHRGYSQLFAESLEESIRFKDKEAADAVIEKANLGNLNSADVRSYLQYYMNNNIGS